MAHVRRIDRARKDGGAWVRWQVRYRTAGGDERSRTFALKRDADRFAAGVQVDQARGDWVDPRAGLVTFREYADEWRAAIRRAPGTMSNMDGRLRNHLYPEFGDLTLAAIAGDGPRVRRWVAELSDRLAPDTVKQCYWLLSKILDTAVADRRITHNPCVRVQLPSAGRRTEQHFIDPADAVLLADEIDRRYRPLVLTGVYGGLRPGELYALTVPRVDLLRATIDVRESLAEVDGRLYRRPTKTYERRTVGIPRFLADELAAHMAAWPGETAATDPAAGPVLFPSPAGHELRRRNFMRRFFRPAVAAAGLPDGLRLYDLRHTHAAIAIAEGAHPRELQERLGHSSIRVTYDVYGHLFPSLGERLRDSLDSVWSRSLEEAEERRSRGVVELR